MTCECGKDSPFRECCGRFLSGAETPTTCEELVRSRFVAFGLGNLDYIEQTQVDPLPEEVRQRQVPEWDRLEIVSCRDGGATDETGEVEFKAYYRSHGLRIHNEKSRFVRQGGQWRYQDGDIVDEEATEGGAKSVGRNQPCPCGSGRKYKRCCGVPARN